MYLALCFWHFGQIEDSWTYLWASLGLWLLTILGRIFWKNQAFRVDTSWPASFPTRLTLVPGGVTRIDVFLPLTVKWRPGQHFYLRFPFLSPFDNHPFTIANIPASPSLSPDEDEAENEKPGPMMVQRATFFARPHSGFTRKIASFARANIDTNESVWLEGPYGGISRNIVRRCDSLILIAGGSGITACLSWLLHCARAMSSSSTTAEKPNNVAIRCVKLIWIVREQSHVEWITEELENAKNLVNGDERLQLTFYITRAAVIGNAESPQHQQQEPQKHPSTAIGNDGEKKEHDEEEAIEKSQDSNPNKLPPLLPSSSSSKHDQNHHQDKNPMTSSTTATTSPSTPTPPSFLGTFHMSRPTISSMLPNLLTSGRNMIIGTYLPTYLTHHLSHNTTPSVPSPLFPFRSAGSIDTKHHFPPPSLLIESLTTPIPLSKLIETPCLMCGVCVYQVAAPKV